MENTNASTGAQSVQDSSNQMENASGAPQSGIDYQALAEKLLSMETSAQMQRIRQLVMLRMALEGDVKPTRIPIPANITEVGGYYNLLRKMNQKPMMRQMVASAVGIPNDCTPDLTEQLLRKLITEIIEQR